MANRIFITKEMYAAMKQEELDVRAAEEERRMKEEEDRYYKSGQALKDLKPDSPLVRGIQAAFGSKLQDRKDRNFFNYDGATLDELKVQAADYRKQIHDLTLEAAVELDETRRRSYAETVKNKNIILRSIESEIEDRELRGEGE